MTSHTDFADHAGHLRTSSAPESVPARSDVVQLLGSKWAWHLIEVLDERGIARFGEIQQALPGLGAKTLTISLRRLVAARLVLRTAYPEVPPRVEYELTALGRGTSRRLREVRGFIESHVALN
jgi:DNA-binding HxlR family transcriptional regulator